MELHEALDVLRANGAVVVAPATERHLSLQGAALSLDLSLDWFRDHLDEFPNAWRLPAGSAAGRNVGELRIPLKDIEALAERQRIRRAA